MRGPCPGEALDATDSALNLALHGDCSQCPTTNTIRPEYAEVLSRRLPGPGNSTCCRWPARRSRMSRCTRSKIASPLRDEPSLDGVDDASLIGSGPVQPDIVGRDC